jgi:hypothetical protein
MIDKSDSSGIANLVAHIAFRRTLYWKVPRTKPSSLWAFRKPPQEALGPLD